MLSLVSLDMTGSLCSFSIVSVKYRSVNNHSLSVVLYNKNLLWKMWLDRLGAKTVTRVLFLKTFIALWYVAEMLMDTFHFIIQNIKKIYSTVEI